MRRMLSIVVLASLLAIAASPLTAGADPSGMACCRKGPAMACCLLDGSCAMRSCPGTTTSAEIGLLPPGVLPSVIVVPAPAAASARVEAPATSPVPPSIPLSDPPPRG